MWASGIGTRAPDADSRYSKRWGEAAIHGPRVASSSTATTAAASDFKIVCRRRRVYGNMLNPMKERHEKEIACSLGTKRKKNSKTFGWVFLGTTLDFIIARGSGRTGYVEGRGNYTPASFLPLMWIYQCAKSWLWDNARVSAACGRSGRAHCPFIFRRDN